MKHAAIRVVLHWNMAPPPVPPALLNVRAGVRVSQCAVQTCDTFDDCLFRIAAALTRRHLTLGVNFYWASGGGVLQGMPRTTATSPMLGRTRPQHDGGGTSN
jgi:hypothetical protein